MTKELQSIISDKLKEINLSDGTIDTSDLIYSVEMNFRKVLSEERSTVQLTKGNRESGKTLVKIKTKSRKNKKKNVAKNEKKNFKDIIRKVLKKDGENTYTKRVRYYMNPESVKRIVLKNKEILVFDFNGVEQYLGETICDISFSLIDGMGKGHESEFNVSDNYSSIYDCNAKTNCNVEKNIIKNVTIVGSKIKLEMEITNKFNSSLKFMYYVEV